MNEEHVIYHEGVEVDSALHNKLNKATYGIEEIFLFA